MKPKPSLFIAILTILATGCARQTPMWFTIDRLPEQHHGRYRFKAHNGSDRFLIVTGTQATFEMYPEATWLFDDIETPADGATVYRIGGKTTNQQGDDPDKVTLSFDGLDMTFSIRDIQFEMEWIGTHPWMEEDTGFFIDPAIEGYPQDLRDLAVRSYRVGWNFGMRLMVTSQYLFRSVNTTPRPRWRPSGPGATVPGVGPDHEGPW